MGNNKLEVGSIKKIIELPIWAVKVINREAKDDGRSTKNLIERIVLQHAEGLLPYKPNKAKHNP